MLESPAWQSLDAVARAVYVEIAKRYNGSNNGTINYSVREAASALQIGKSTAHRALLRLQEHGFIVAMTVGAFSLKIRHATEWRMTEHPDNRTGSLSTKDFMRWRPEIQNSVPVAGPSVPVAKPIGTCGGTVNAKNHLHGTCSETVELVFGHSTVS
jgi:hypothetical protein